MTAAKAAKATPDYMEGFKTRFDSMTPPGSNFHKPQPAVVYGNYNMVGQHI